MALTDEQFDKMFDACYPNGKHYGRTIEQAVRNATLDEVAQMVQEEYVYAYSVEFAERLRQMKEEK